MFQKNRPSQSVNLVCAYQYKGCKHMLYSPCCCSGMWRVSGCVIRRRVGGVMMGGIKWLVNWHSGVCKTGGWLTSSRQISFVRTDLYGKHRVEPVKDKASSRRDSQFPFPLSGTESCDARLVWVSSRQSTVLLRRGLRIVYTYVPIAFFIYINILVVPMPSRFCWAWQRKLGLPPIRFTVLYSSVSLLRLLTALPICGR